MKQKCFYSVVDLNKAMPKQNLFPFRVDWNNNQILIQNLLWFFFFTIKKEGVFVYESLLVYTGKC